jgi:hypothetical protein
MWGKASGQDQWYVFYETAAGIRVYQETESLTSPFDAGYTPTPANKPLPDGPFMVGGRQFSIKGGFLDTTKGDGARLPKWNEIGSE